MQKRVVNLNKFESFVAEMELYYWHGMTREVVGHFDLCKRCKAHPPPRPASTIGGKMQSVVNTYVAFTHAGLTTRYRTKSLHKSIFM